ncbi:phage holin, lambda family [Pseudomonas sp. GG8]
MPDKPYTWAIVLAWLHEHASMMYAVGLSLVMTVLRTFYRGGTWCQALLEGPMCMLFTLSLIPVLELFELSQNLASAAGIWIGYFGARKVSSLVERYASAKLPSP